MTFFKIKCFNYYICYILLFLVSLFLFMKNMGVFYYNFNCEILENIYDVKNYTIQDIPYEEFKKIVKKYLKEQLNNSVLKKPSNSFSTWYLNEKIIDEFF